MHKHRTGVRFLELRLNTRMVAGRPLPPPASPLCAPAHTRERMSRYTSSASLYCPHLMQTFISAEKVCTLRSMPRSRISCGGGSGSSK